MVELPDICRQTAFYFEEHWRNFVSVGSIW